MMANLYAQGLHWRAVTETEKALADAIELKRIIRSHSHIEPSVDEQSRELKRVRPVVPPHHQ